VIGGDIQEGLYCQASLLYDTNRDYVMVPYSDFMKAVLGEQVEPYVIFSRKKVFVRVGGFDSGRMPDSYRRLAMSGK